MLKIKVKLALLTHSQKSNSTILHKDHSVTFEIKYNNKTNLDQKNTT